MNKHLITLEREIVLRQKELGYTDRQMADLLNMSEAYWKKIKRGEKGLGGSAVVSIIQAFPDLIMVIAVNGKTEFFKKAYGIPQCPLCKSPVSETMTMQYLASKGGTAGGKKGGETTLKKIGVQGYKAMRQKQLKEKDGNSND